jgi:hypothetical protein
LLHEPAVARDDRDDRDDALRLVPASTWSADWSAVG